MKADEKTSEAPGVAVMRALRSPPVHDSAPVRV